MRYLNRNIIIPTRRLQCSKRSAQPVMVTPTTNRRAKNVALRPERAERAIARAVRPHCVEVFGFIVISRVDGTS